MTLPPVPVLQQYWDTSENRQRAINGIFDRSARHYDWLCRAMSFGSGQSYRRRALERAGIGGGQALQLGIFSEYSATRPS